MDTGRVCDFRDTERRAHRTFNAAGWMVEVREMDGSAWLVTMNASSGARHVFIVDGSLDDATRAAALAASGE